MQEYEENMKELWNIYVEYEENMKKWEENMKKYKGITLLII